MKKKNIRKSIASTVLAFLMMITVLSIAVLSSAAYASNQIFQGIENAQAEENSTFDVLQGVSAATPEGQPLQVVAAQVICDSDPQYLYDGSNQILMGQAGTVYRVLYQAFSETNPEETYTVERLITSVANPSAERPQDWLSEQPQDLQPEPFDKIQELPEKVVLSPGLLIIFENGFHYVNDPAYPNERILLYCMNNKLAWPHSVSDHPVVPDYAEGYLQPDHFESAEEYQECIQKLRRVLFAGYPYNGQRLYKIVEQSEMHVPTQQEFNEMLIVPPQLKNAFDYLGNHDFTLDTLTQQTDFNELLRFMDDVWRLYPDGMTSTGLTYADITSMPFYKAANSLTFFDFGADEKDVREIFANLYSSSYFVTEVQAYDATQLAVWRLLDEYGVEHNDIQSLEHDALAKILWKYCQKDDLLDRAPSEKEISIQGDLQFRYDAKDGKWHSGKLKIIEPAEYNGLYHLNLPKGVTAICDKPEYVYGNEEYELVADEKPQSGSQFQVEAEIHWLKDMKQYSPIGNLAFQHMVGAVIRRTPISKKIVFDAAQDGTLEITKKVEGKQKDAQEAFAFTLTLSDSNINGVYGDLEFHDGVAQFTLKNGETKRAEHLPLGIDYTVTETEHPDYTATVTNGQGKITKEQTIYVSFVNHRKATLALSKEVAGELGDKTKKFTFLISLQQQDGTPVQGSFPYVGSVIASCAGKVEAPADGSLLVENGEARIELSHGQRVEIQGLPFDCVYTVTEQQENQDGYVTKYITGKTSRKAPTGTVEAHTEIHVLNTKEYIPETGIKQHALAGLAVVVSIAAAALMIPMAGDILRKRKGSK